MMRISTGQFYQSGMIALGKQQSELLKLYQQFSSGRRVVTPDDDPLAAAQAINIAQAKSLTERLAINRSSAMQSLSSQENVMNAVTLTYQDIQQRLVEAGSGTLNDADRQTLSEVFSSLKENLLALANSKDGNGQYLFSGHQGDREPFVRSSDGSIDWIGDQGKRLIQVDNTRQINTADDGMSLFMTAPKGSRSYFTTAAATNTGSAVLSSPVMTDLNGAYAGQDFTLSFSGSPAMYSVNVHDKSGALLTSTVPAPFDATQPTLTLPGGVSVTISGEPADGDTFTVQNVQGADINIFDTLDQLIGALQSPVASDARETASFRNTLNMASQLVNENYNAVLTSRAALGVRINELEALNDAGSLALLNYRSELSRLEDLDFYTATMNLNMRLAGLEAASAAFQKIQSLSLFTMKQ